MNPEDVKKAFLDDFRALLAKYNATLDIVDDGYGYRNLSCVEFDIPSIYNDDGDTVRPYTTINIGAYFTKDSE